MTKPLTDKTSQRERDTEIISSSFSSFLFFFISVRLHGAVLKEAHAAGAAIAPGLGGLRTALRVVGHPSHPQRVVALELDPQATCTSNKRFFNERKKRENFIQLISTLINKREITYLTPYS